jgi:hypothetical protein
LVRLTGTRAVGSYDGARLASLPIVGGRGQEQP